MKITSQEEYGVRCLLRLARAGAEQWLTIPEIAAAEKLSVPHVGKLLAVLRQAGLIESSRGRSGGYRLAKAPAEIGLGSALLVLGEPLFDAVTFCQQHAGTDSKGVCVHHDGCTLRGLWHGLEQWIQSILNHLSLADLLQHETRIPDLLRSHLSNALVERPPLLPLKQRPVD